MSKPEIAYCQLWEESERGWGQRPDGFSLHASEEAAKRYIKAYWDEMPKEVPDEYERPSGSPFLVKVSGELFAKLEKMDGQRFWTPRYGPKPGELVVFEEATV